MPGEWLASGSKSGRDSRMDRASLPSLAIPPGPELGGRCRYQTDRQGFLGQTAGRGPFRSVSGEYLAQCREQSTVHASEISSILESVAGLMGRSGLTKPGGC